MDTEEIKKESEPPQLTVLHAVGLMILLLVLQLLISMLLSRLGSPLFSQQSWVNISLTQAIAGLLTAQAGAILAGFSLLSILAVGSFQGGMILPLMVGTLGISILASELGNILHWISPISEEYLKIIETLYQQDIVGIVLAIGVVAPVVEELVFRGVILSGLETKYGSAKAVMISSLLFGLIHVFPWSIINAFLLGLIFAWLKLQTRSLVACMIAHSLYNCLPLLLTRFGSLDVRGYTTMPGETVEFQPLWFDVAGILLVLVGFFWIRQVMESSQQERETYGTGQ